MKGVRNKDRRFPQMFLALAGLLVALGIGNALYGASKASHYLSVVQSTERELAKPHKPVFPLIDPALTVDREQQHLRRLRGSYQFYIFVRRAGMTMIAIGLLCMVPSLCCYPNKQQRAAP